MRYVNRVSHPENPTGGNNKDQQKNQTADEKLKQNKSANIAGNQQRNDSDGNSNIGASNEFNTDLSRNDASQSSTNSEIKSQPEDIF